MLKPFSMMLFWRGLENFCLYVQCRYRNWRCGTTVCQWHGIVKTSCKCSVTINNKYKRLQLSSVNIEKLFLYIVQGDLTNVIINITCIYIIVHVYSTRNLHLHDWYTRRYSILIPLAVYKILIYVNIIFFFFIT